MKVVIYCRVSTDDKDQNPDRQIDPCKKYCEIHDHDIVEIITEYYTGDSDPFTRPKGKCLLKKKAKGIVVFSIDRLTRQHPIKVIRMINDLKYKDVKIISVTESAFNMEGEFGDLIIYIMTWFNNYFLTKLKKDIKSGIEKARRDGKQIGRKKLDFDVVTAGRLLKEGKSYGQVSKELNVPKATLFRRFKTVQKKQDKP